MKIAILEPGAWGTALGIILSKKNQLSFWYDNQDLVLKLAKSRENERLPEIKIPPKIFISSDFEKVIENADLVIIASPSFNFRKTLLELKKLEELPPLLGIAKGIEKETLKLPSQIVQETLGEISYAHLSGPGFAREVVRGKSAREVIASKDNDLLEKLKEVFKIKPLKILISEDLIGVQLAGALKNALAIGISLVEAGSQGAGVKKIRGNLTQLGLKEMIEVGKAFNVKKETFLGPAGLEDLVLTSGSQLSRNFQFGRDLFSDAEKMRKEIAERKITVEGFDSIFALYNLRKIYKLDLPMIQEIYKVIYKKTSPEKAVKNLVKLV